MDKSSYLPQILLQLAVDGPQRVIFIAWTLACARVPSMPLLVQDVKPLHTLQSTLVQCHSVRAGALFWH